MNSLINQEAFIYSLVLTYSTRCFDQNERQVLAITRYSKRQFLVGNSEVEFQLPVHGLTLSIHFCSEKTTK